MSTEAEIRKIVQAELERAGMDTEEVDETQADFAFIRRKRKLEERLAVGVRLAFITAAVALVLEVGRYALTGEW
jgi:hypothetical protein